MCASVAFRTSFKTNKKLDSVTQFCRLNHKTRKEKLIEIEKNDFVFLGL
jgi:flagellar motor component MotA